MWSDGRDNLHRKWDLFKTIERVLWKNENIFYSLFYVYNWFIATGKQGFLDKQSQINKTWITVENRLGRLILMHFPKTCNLTALTTFRN